MVINCEKIKVKKSKKNNNFQPLENFSKIIARN